MNTKHEEFFRLGELMREECREAPIYYCANPGNWGDALIRQGTLKFFRDFEIEYTELTNRKRVWIIPAIKGGTVIFGGGGGWCPHYNHSIKIVNKLRYRFRVIVLPSTYAQYYPIPNTLFFCRDLFESKVNMPDAIFCHDMAFYIGAMKSLPGSGTGYFFRVDKESSGRIRIPENNVDLSLKGWHYSDVEPFFEEIARHEVIYTDRLHVGIAACLLGRELHLFPGSYFKSRAIFDSSIRGRFPNAYFHDTYEIHD